MIEGKLYNVHAKGSRSFSFISEERYVGKIFPGTTQNGWCIKYIAVALLEFNQREWTVSSSLSLIKLFKE